MGNVGVFHFWATLAAWLLTGYALVYSLLLLVFAVPFFTMSDAIWVLSMLGLAATPILALVYLPAVRRGAKGGMPAIMSAIMACPSVFWGFVYLGEFRPADTLNVREAAMAFFLTGMPAVLSVIVLIAFARAIRPTRNLS